MITFLPSTHCTDRLRTITVIVTVQDKVARTAIRTPPSKRPGTDHQVNDGGNGPSPAKRQRGEFELTMRPGQFEETLRQPLDQYGEANGWILGPDSTAEDAVRKLSSTFSQA